ncbi:MAG: PEP-CTERM sorting domain-containing protein [Deltaproteobacteria bacterium]|nr:PEP-CTERM sorting domain-containing protein [Deltaproteobacteria bacterium]
MLIRSSKFLPLGFAAALLALVAFSENANATSFSIAQASIGPSGQFSYTGDFEIVVGSSSASSYASADYLSGSWFSTEDTDSASGFESLAQRVFSPSLDRLIGGFSYSSSQDSRIFSRAYASAGDSSELTTPTSLSFGLGYTDVFIALRLTTPGVLSFSVDAYLDISGYRDDTLEGWGASAFATAELRHGNDSLDISTFGISADQLTAPGLGGVANGETVFETLTITFDAAELFLESNGLPVDLILSLSSNTSTSAFDERVPTNVPEPMTLALLGIAGLFGRKRFGQRV